MNDSLVVAAAREAGVAQLASADPDFARVKDFKLYQPGDLGQTARACRRRGSRKIDG